MTTTSNTNNVVLLDLDASPVGRVRTARKAWRCTCADPVRYWRVVGHYGRSWSARGFSTEAEAQVEAAAMIGRVAAWDTTVSPAVPSAHYERVEVEPVPNRNHRPDCLVDIAVGDRYFEYLGDAAFFDSGTRYCARCAAVWVGVS